MPITPSLDASLTDSPACLALFDDCNATDLDPRSRLYTGYYQTLQCTALDQLAHLLTQIEQTDLHAVILFSYELGAALQDIAPHGGDRPLAQVLLFAHCRSMSAAAVSDWLADHADAQPAGVADIAPNITADEFEHAVERIQAYITAGDTYQVNLTYRLRFDAYGSPLTLYRALRARQNVPFGALIILPDQTAVLSHSPELFLRHRGGIVTAQPMKGTAAASVDGEYDTEIATALAADPKNRAENVMIVDLLRNDLGRIAKLGSVAVPRLFEVTRFGQVLQMTSTVTAALRDGVTLADIVNAVYPCGSITGAPKRRSMQIIRELEADPRGLYTGAIGWFAAAEINQTTPVPNPRASLADFCWSVPIRTLVLAAPDATGLRRGEMGIGSGIVRDSVAADELLECRLKARFLTDLPKSFSLFETMAVTRDAGCVLLERHLQRLARSAAYFHFAFDETAIRQALHAAYSALPDTAIYRLRLSLSQDGSVAIQTAPLPLLNATIESPVRLLIASEPMSSDDLFLRHKTTQRTRYDQAWKAAEAQGAFDMLFCNQHGQVTEGARSNLFVKIDGRWYTPPLAVGVLPGVMRAQLLEDPAWSASERVMRLDDVRAAQSIVVCNALRGVLPARLDVAT